MWGMPHVSHRISRWAGTGVAGGGLLPHATSAAPTTATNAYPDRGSMARSYNEATSAAPESPLRRRRDVDDRRRECDRGRLACPQVARLDRGQPRRGEVGLGRRRHRLDEANR